MRQQKIVFAVFALLILAVPLWVMFSSEEVLQNGHLHKIKLQAYDPVDPFRGKYLRLNYDNMVECDPDLETRDECYVTLKKDKKGFSYFDYAHKNRPEGDDYFTSFVQWIHNGQAEIDLNNMSKYFINEDKAPKAEKYVQEYQQKHPDDIYVAIRITDGEVRLEDIFIEEMPLLEFLDKQSDTTTSI